MRTTSRARSFQRTFFLQEQCNRFGSTTTHLVAATSCVLCLVLFHHVGDLMQTHIQDPDETRQVPYPALAMLSTPIPNMGQILHQIRKGGFVSAARQDVLTIGRKSPTHD